MWGCHQWVSRGKVVWVSEEVRGEEGKGCEGDQHDCKA